MHHTPNNRDQVWERLTSQDMIAEELLEQCPEMAALHPSSVNTVRALTIRGKLCSAVLRMGVGGGFVDNGCSGGIFAGLDVTPASSPPRGRSDGAPLPPPPTTA